MDCGLHAGSLWCVCVDRLVHAMFTGRGMAVKGSGCVQGLVAGRSKPGQALPPVLWPDPSKA